MIQKVLVVSRAPTQLPFLLEDAARSQLDIESSQDSDRPFAGVSQVMIDSFSLSYRFINILQLLLLLLL